MPAPKVEYDHFPVPQRYGGKDTVAACMNCHHLKDRTTLDQWPSGQVIAAFSELISHEFGVQPLVFLQAWGTWADAEPMTGGELPPSWDRLSPLAKVMWARLLCTKLDGLANGKDAPDEVAIALGLALNIGTTAL